MTRRENSGGSGPADKHRLEKPEFAALNGLNIGFALTGSHCTFERVIAQMGRLKELGATVYPIISDTVRLTDTRFGKACEWREKILAAGGNPEIIDSMVGAEPVGPDKFLDVLLIAPCSGNTLGKLANGITDSPVLMAAKAHLRNQKPLILAVSTNDGLGANGKNIGLLLNTKHIFFVPFGQDNPLAKPNSLMADMKQIPQALVFALDNRQIQPMLVQAPAAN